MRRGRLLWALCLAAAAIGSNCTYILGLEGVNEEDYTAGAGGTGTAAGGNGPGSGGGGGCTQMCGDCVNIATDANHCGGCNRDCDEGGCAGGECQPAVLPTGQGATSLISDSGNVYWVNADGAVKSLSPDEGAEAMMKFTFPSGFVPKELAVKGGTFGAISDDDVIVTLDGNDFKYPRGTVTTAPDSVALHENAIFWTELSPNLLYKGTFDGMDPNTLFGTQPNPRDVALDGTDLYWLADNKLWIVDINGDMPDELYPLTDATQIAVRDGRVCATINLGLAISCADLNTGMGANFYADDATIGALVVADSHVYWAESAGRVVRGNIADETSKVLAEELAPPVSIAVLVDNEDPKKHRVFWADNGGSMYKLVTWVE